MSDEDISGESELLKKHRLERKEFQAKITSLKRSVPQRDKKRKKEIMDQIARLEAEMSERHKQELLRQNNTVINTMANGVDEHLRILTITGDDQVKPESEQKVPKISKAQKRRDKKTMKEKEREQRIAEQEAENLFGVRHMESEKLKAILKEKKLAVYDIPSDGDCLYAAIVHQLLLQGVSASVKSLRQQVSQFMKDHRDEFLPFLGELDNGEIVTIEKFDQLCDDIESKSVWGGQLEIRAISHIFQQPVEVIQADSPTILIGEEFNRNPLILVYHRHAYGLGEHYNSIVEESATFIEDDFT